MWRVLLIPFPQVAVSFSDSPSPAAASSETLKCEGLVSTEQGSCQAAAEEDEGDEDDGDMTQSSEAGFQFKGYTFSKPFHLSVSYGEIPVPQTTPGSPSPLRELA